MNPGSDMPCGCASSVTGRLPSLREARTARRVGSASAANTLSSSRSDSRSRNLTIKFSIAACCELVKRRHGLFAALVPIGPTYPMKNTLSLLPSRSRK